MSYPISTVVVPSGARAYLGYRKQGVGTVGPFGVGQRISSITASNNVRLQHTLGSRKPYWAIPMQFEGTVNVETVLSIDATNNFFNLDLLYEGFGIDNTGADIDPTLYEIWYSYKRGAEWLVHKLGNAVLNNIRVSANVGETITFNAEFRFGDAEVASTVMPADCTTATGAGADLCALANNTDTSTLIPLAFYDAKLKPDGITEWPVQRFELRLNPNNELTWKLGDRLAFGYYGGRVEGRFSAVVYASIDDPLVKAYTGKTTAPFNPDMPYEFASAVLTFGAPHGSYVRGGTASVEKTVSFKMVIDEVSHPLEVGEVVAFEVSGFVFGDSISIV